MKLSRIIYALAAALCFAVPAQAQSAGSILYASDGPAVQGMSYCYQVMVRGADPDVLAEAYGFQVPLTDFGTEEVLARMSNGNRWWRVNYTGSTVGTGAVPDDDALSMSVRLRGHDCEVSILGVPLSQEEQVLDVTYQILEKLDPQFVPRAHSPFGRILVAGVGPAWHGTIWLQHERFDSGISFGPRISPYAGALWEIELVRRGS